MTPNAVCCDNGYTCCPSGTKCVDTDSGWHVTTVCEPVEPSSTARPVAAAPIAGKQICKIGPNLPADPTRKNAIVLGDSVSIGFTPPTAALLNSTIMLQHAPYSSDGGACETAYGLQCLDNFIRGTDGTEIAWDLIYFNFGLHNLVPDNESFVPGQSGRQSDYLPSLEKIADRLLEVNKTLGTKIVFGLTTPEMCDASKDAIVQSLNKQALGLMRSKSIPVVDAHAAVIQECGPSPQDTCLGKARGGCPHYSAEGYEWIAKNIVGAAIQEYI